MLESIVHDFFKSRRALCALCGLIQSACTTTASTESHAAPPLSPNPAAYTLGPLLHTDNFANLDHWKPELEAPGTVTAANRTLEIDVPKGATLWFAHELSGPILIHYEARMLRTDPPGPNDRVSDLNCFWMATDPRAASQDPHDFFHVPGEGRTGAFATYHQLKTYYVGLGGNTNTTTRFRRYIGDAANRPLLPEHDLSSPDTLLTPNTWQTIQLVACHNRIEYYRDGKRLFSYTDPAPYTRGYFALRTTWNHMQIRNLNIYRLLPTQ